MIRIGLIGDGIDSVLLREFPIQVSSYARIGDEDNLEFELTGEQLRTWAQQDTETALSSEATITSKAISMLLQAMRSYASVEFHVAHVPLFSQDSVMRGFVKALEWMAYKVNPDYLYIGFSSQDGRFHKQQNRWTGELNQQGCKIMAPAGAPPAFPAQLDHVMTAADKGFVEAGFQFSKPDIIIEDSFVVVFTGGIWARRPVSNELASALALSEMIRTRLDSVNEYAADRLLLPSIDEMISSEVQSSNSHTAPQHFPKPGLLLKVRRYIKSVGSRVIINNGKVPSSIKAIRKLSCNSDGDALGACQFRMNSKRRPDSFICGACGCGDRKDVFVDGHVPKFEMLDYPYVHCPASMPGFSNYLRSQNEHKPGIRKEAIESRLGSDALIEASHIQDDFNKLIQKRIGRLDSI